MGDNGACPATDQRGAARPLDGDGDSTATCDIGAYEKPEASTTVITADTPDPSMTNQNVAVTVTVTGTGATPTGTVDITGADTNCTITLSGGAGSCNAVFTSSGNKTITATYNGDLAHNSSSDTDSHDVRVATTFRSVGTQDGWILESSETSNVGGTLNNTANVFNLGDDATDKQYRAILSFNTYPLPDTAVITKVTLKIKKQGLVGTDPFTTHGVLYFDINTGGFSGNGALQAGDFQATASKAAAGTIPNTPVYGWYSKVLNSNIFSFINKTGLTQFRLRFQLDDNNDNGADNLRFFSGDHTTVSYRPTLIIEYYVP